MGHSLPAIAALLCISRPQVGELFPTLSSLRCISFDPTVAQDVGVDVDGLVKGVFTPQFKIE